VSEATFTELFGRGPYHTPWPALDEVVLRSLGLGPVEADRG
jgi:hypothetical protein